MDTGEFEKVSAQSSGVPRIVPGADRRLPRPLRQPTSAELKKRRRTYYKFTGLYVAAGLLSVSAINQDWNLPGSVRVILAVLAGLILLVALWVLFHDRIRAAEEREHLAQGALDAAIANVKHPNDLLGFLQVNRKQMDAYDAQVRSQSVTSHWISLGAMVVGLGIVAAGLSIAYVADDAATKYSAAIIAAVGTATGGYIAQTFIRLNTAAQDQVRYHFEQPLVQSYLLTAERVISLMPEVDRPDQYRRLVEASLKQAGMVPEYRTPSRSVGLARSEPPAVPAEHQ